MDREKERLFEYDIMRILACICVIMIHCAVFDQKNLYDFSSSEYQAINFWGVISRWAVPAFVMLSGMLILPQADNVTIRYLIKHRVARMLAVYIGWSAVYSFYNTYVLGNIYAPTKFKTFIDGCFSGEIHMWYLPMLAGLYVISPLLSSMVKKMNVKWSLYWLVGLFLYSSVIPFLIHMDIKFLSTIINSINGYMNLQFLGGWTFYFVIGYYIQKHSFTYREKNAIFILAILSLAFTMFGTVVYSAINGETMGILPYEYPNNVMFSIGVLLLFKENVAKIKVSERIKLFIYKISKLTFGIYLIHVLLLEILYNVGINIQLFHPLLSIPFISIIVFSTGSIIIWFFRKIPIIGTYFA